VMGNLHNRCLEVDMETSLKEVELVFKVKIATYKVRELVEHQTKILDSFQDVINRILYTNGISSDAVLTLSGEE